MSFLPFLLALGSTLSAQASPAETPTILNVAVGHQRVIAAKGVRRAAIGNPLIADVRAMPENDQVMLTGLMPGSTSLILWKSGGSKIFYTVRVEPGGRTTEEIIRTLLVGIEGIVVERKGDTLFVSGELFRGDDWARLEKVRKRFPNLNVSAHMNPDALSYVANQAQREIDAATIGKIRVSAGHDTLYLEGDAAKKSDLRKAERIARDHFPVVSSDVTVEFAVEPLVLVDVRMMEVKTNALGSIGLDWPSGVSATGSFVLSQGNSSSYLQVGQGAAVTLKALVEKGAAKLLSNPKLLCRNGVPASFTAGGEIPIRLVSERTASVTFKSYGIQLNVTAKTNRSGETLLEIDSRLSDLDYATAVDGIPGIVEHRVKTSASLRLGDTVAIGGLLENRSRKNVRKVPFFGHVPVLGELFKSREFQRNESQFLIFLTPLRANAGTEAQERELMAIKKAMRQGENEVKLSILD